MLAESPARPHLGHAKFILFCQMSGHNPEPALVNQSAWAGEGTGEGTENAAAAGADAEAAAATMVLRIRLRHRGLRLGCVFLVAFSGQ